MIRRAIAPFLHRLASRYPVITLTGPRQSGKTTLARMEFPDLAYVSLEDPDSRRFAIEDPRGYPDYFKGLRTVSGHHPAATESGCVIYGGDFGQSRSDWPVHSWRTLEHGKPRTTDTPEG